MVRKIFSVGLILMFNLSIAQHATTVDGDWNDPNIWDQMTVPGSMDNVTITHNVTFNVASATVGNLAITNGTLSIGSNEILNVSSVNMLADVSESDCYISINGAGGVLNVAGDFNYTQNAGSSSSLKQVYIVNGGALNVTNNGNMTLTFNDGGNESSIEFHLRHNSQLNVAGDLTLIKNGGSSFFSMRNGNDGESPFITVGGNFSMLTNNSGTHSIRFDQFSQNGEALGVMGDIIINHLNNTQTADVFLNIYSGGLEANNLIVTSINEHFGANVNLNFGSLANTTSTNASFSGYAQFDLFNDANGEDDRGDVNLAIENESSLSIGGNYVVNVGETPAISEVFSHISTASTTTISGNLSINITDNGGSPVDMVYFDFQDGSTFNGSTFNLQGNIDFNSTYVNRTSSIQLLGNAQMFHRGAFDFSPDDSGTPIEDSFVMDPGAHLTLNSTSSLQALYDRNGINYSNVTIDNTSGPGVVLFGESTVTITGSLHLENGVLHPGGLLQLVFADGSSASSTNGYVSGPVTKIGNDPFLFPVGKGSRRGMLEISAPNDVADELTVEYFNSDAELYNFADPLEDVSTLEHWTIQGSEGGTDQYISLQLYWDSEIASGIGDYSLLIPAVLRTTTNTWLSMDRASATSFGQNGFVISNPISMTVFTNPPIPAYVTFGTEEMGDTLPVEFLGFEGKEEASSIKLSWSTATELNNDHFEVERSTDGVQFEGIGKVDGNGTTNEVSSYSFVDTKPTSGTSFYRLRQVDYDGQFDYSKTIQLTPEWFDAQVSVYPNPVRPGEEFTIDMRGLISTESPISIQLMDLSGAVIKEIDGNLKDPVIRLELPQLELASSLLLLNISTQGQLIQTVKIVVKP